MHMQAFSNRPYAAFLAGAALLLAWERRQSQRDNMPQIPSKAACESWSVFAHYPSFSSPSVALCESSNSISDKDLSTPSRLRRTLALLRIKSLPLPRRLVPNDAVFSDTALQRGLRQRKRDEEALRGLQSQIITVVQDGKDPEAIRDIHQQVCEIAFGKGVTPQIREDFVVKYGCTGWTEEVLDALVDLADSRGFVEIGAGHGQWTRALTTRHERQHVTSTLDRNNTSKVFDFVLAFDDMSELPLSPEIYHEHTQHYHDYFYSRVQQCDDINLILRQWSCRGRVLLLVYPPPGRMAVDTVKAYANLGPENDTVVYVGEGRGGANANNDLFDYLESGDWAVIEVLPVKSPPGGKGYEKLHILQRLKVPKEADISTHYN
jgi:hypothetical protein